MLSNAKLFSVGDFDFRLQHLLIIGVLVMAVSTSALLRAQPAEYGFALHEFDPYFNYRATEFIVDNGYSAYLEWNDDKSWHPIGRDVSATSQVMLHLSTATLYNIFGGNSSLYDFTVMFPLVIGSLTCLVVFALVRVIGGTTAGLLAALMFAISLPILLRGMIGWYKSEPFGLFLSFIAIYLFLSAIKKNKGKISFIKLISGGVVLGLSLAAWGGNQFFLLPLAIYFIALPFFNSDRKFLFWSIPAFSISLLLTALSFERPGITFVIGYGGLLVILPTIFMVLMLVVQTFSNQATRIRNSIFVLGALIASGIGILGSGILDLPSFRYFNAINPFLSSDDPLVASVSEHMTTDIQTSFAFSSIFIIFGLIGAWLLFSHRSRDSELSIPNHMKVFVLICGLTGIYTGSAFVRLELFGNIALIILGSVGLTILLQHVLKKQNLVIKFIFCAVVIGLMITPMMIPEKSNWVVLGNQIPVIFNGATFYSHTTNDWIDAMSWIKENTPSDSVIFSWWDYGYWIQTLGERTTLADNATLSTDQIEKIARTFLSPVDDAWVILNSDVNTDVSEHYIAVPTNLIDMAKNEPDEYLKHLSKPFSPVTGLDADYILIHIAGVRYETDSFPLYDLHGGGDETKKYWFMAIGGLAGARFHESDGFTPNEYFQENTLFGNLVPFSIFSYFDPETMEQYSSYRNGLTALYVKDIKFQDPDGPFMLVYASPSFSETNGGALQTVLIYKVNHDFMG